MNLDELLSHFTLTHAVIALAVVVIFVVARRSGILLTRLQLENRKLRRGIDRYAGVERHHKELSREAGDRDRFHRELPLLISRLGAERTLPGICRHLIDFTRRILEATEVDIFLARGPDLVFIEGTGLPGPGFRIRIGEGPIGIVGQLRRTLDSRGFRRLDAATRERLHSPSARRVDTKIATPLLAHGNLLGVLNVGGEIGAAEEACREILTVVSQLGGTALENQINFERLEREATTDGLTGLANVRTFRERLNQELARAARYGRPFSVFLFDLDHFKNYNDRNGHPAGDECLRLTSEVLRNSLRATDLSARYGGEEFIVLLPETEVDGALRVAEKVRAAIAALDYPFREGQPLGCVSISGGVATYPQDGRDGDALVAAADAALYACKESGRNKVTSASATRPDPGVRPLESTSLS